VCKDAYVVAFGVFIYISICLSQLNECTDIKFINAHGHTDDLRFREKLVKIMTSRADLYRGRQCPLIDELSANRVWLTRFQADIITVLLLSVQTATDLRRRGYRWNEIISGIVHIYSARERYVLTGHVISRHIFINFSRIRAARRCVMAMRDWMCWLIYHTGKYSLPI